MCLLFFFFQAEDGIPDWSVTGVQTCALPICILLDAAALLGSRPAQAARVRPGRRSDGAAGVGRGRDQTADAVVHADSRAEIGRASCRERGEVTGVEGLCMK